MSPLQPTERKADDLVSFDINFEESFALFDKVNDSGAPSPQPTGISDLIAEPTRTTKLTDRTTSISKEESSLLRSSSPNRSIYGFSRSDVDLSTTQKISPSTESTKKDRHLLKSLKVSSISPEKTPKVAVKTDIEKKSNEDKSKHKSKENDYQTNALTTFAAMILGGILLGVGGWSIYEISLPTNLPFWEKIFHEEIDTYKEFIDQKFSTIFGSNDSNNEPITKETPQNK